MKKNFLWLILVFTSITWLTPINYCFYNFQHATINSKNRNVNDVFFNLLYLKKITSPQTITVKQAQNVTYNEVQTSLETNVENAVLALVPFVSINDYTFRIYADANQDPYQNLNLVNQTGNVYVIIAASPSSKTLVGATNPLQVTLPIAISQQFNLNSLTKIIAPTAISATNLANVTYNEIQLALKDNIFNAIQTLAPDATENDFWYFIAKDNQGDTFQNLDLEGQNNTVYIKVISSSQSDILVNQSDYIAVQLPIYKFSLSSIISITNNFIELNANNLKSVTYEEIFNQLFPYVEQAVNNKTPLAQYNNDFNFQIVTDINNKTYQNINIFEQTNVVYIIITANPNSNLVENSSFPLPIVLLGQRSNISDINSIVATKTDFNSIDLTNVSLSQLHDVLNQNMLSAIQNINNHATVIDYDFQLYTDESNYQNQNNNLSINLYDNPKLYVQIEANDNSAIITGKTNLIAISLPHFEYNTNFFTYNWWWIILLVSLIFILIIFMLKKIKK